MGWAFMFLGQGLRRAACGVGPGAGRGGGARTLDWRCSVTANERAREEAIQAVISGSVVPGSSGMSRAKAERIVDALVAYQLEFARTIARVTP